MIEGEPESSRQKAVRLRETGLSYAEIGRRLGTSRQCVWAIVTSYKPKRRAKLPTRSHPIFIKYTRDWLSEVTGYSKGYLCRVATGKVTLSRSFIEGVCFKLGEPGEELFLPSALVPSLRETGLSYAEIGRRLGISRARVRRASKS